MKSVSALPCLALALGSILPARRGGVLGDPKKRFEPGRWMGRMGWR